MYIYVSVFVCVLFFWGWGEGGGGGEGFVSRCCVIFELWVGVCFCNEISLRSPKVYGGLRELKVLGLGSRSDHVSSQGL